MKRVNEYNGDLIHVPIILIYLPFRRDGVTDNKEAFKIEATIYYKTKLFITIPAYK